MENNYGTVEYNDGWLNNNFKTVENNNGRISDNESGGIVENNNISGSIIQNDGTVESNSGSISTNDGTVESNSGSISTNNGTVENNLPGGSVSGSNGSIINNDGGDVASTGSSSSQFVAITNYYSGTLSVPENSSKIKITNNYSDNAYDSGEITDTNRFHSVTVEGANNADVTYSRPEFIHNDYNNKEYLQVKENGAPKSISGSITIKAKNGYKISDEGVMNNEIGQLAYTLNRNTDGSYTVTLMNLNGNVTVTPANLHLIISAIENQNNTPGITGGSTTPITITKANIAEVPANNSSSNNASASSNNGSGVATPNFTQEAINSIQAQAQAQASLAEQTGTPLQILDIYFDKKIDINPMLIRYLCEQISLPKRCHFNYNDQHYVLFIPAFDISAPAYQDGLDMLDKEPAKTAGFLRIEQLFKPLGFATNIIEEEEAEAVLQ
ncbi:hypothetical protein D6853_06640 [Butyrivibrio sp. X503]|nr:hypothetical protein D6853_06640 [Butyrivibrio sp. X503]